MLPMKLENKGKTIRIATKILLIVAIPVVLSYLLTNIIPIPAFSLKREVIEPYLVSFRSFAPVAYIILQALTVPLVPIPSVILATVAGALFGFKLATVYTTIAWLLGTSINFYLTRIFGRPFLKKLLKEDEIVMVDKFACNLGWKIIFFTWFVPGGTADIAGYAAGLTKMTYTKYISAALLAALILAVLTSAAGATISVNPIFTSIFTVGAVIGILLGFKIVFIHTLISRLIRKLKEKVPFKKRNSPEGRENRARKK